MRESPRLYRWLVRLYPARFREEYGEPLQRQFLDEYAEARTWRDVARLWMATLADFLRSMPRLAAQEIGQDARHCLRLWRRRPLHTAFTIGVLAVSIGATTGVFSVLNALLLRSLPFEQPERLATLKNFSPPRDDFHRWRQQSSYLSDAALYDSYEVNLGGVEPARRARLTETSWNFFATLGREPIIGRGFREGEDVAGRAAVAVLSYGLWRDLFAESAAALGTTVRLNGTPLTIIGVAPPGFDFPQNTAVWTPTTFDFQQIPKTGSVVMWTTIGRLEPGFSWPQAQAAFEAEAYQRAPDRRNADAVNRPALVPLQTQLAGPARQASLVLMYGVALLLLVACANVANLLLARTVARTSELRIRTALGASRARIVQQLVTEALLLAVLATLAGLAVATWIGNVATLAQPPQLVAQSYSILDPRVMAFAIGVSLITALTFIVGPALYASRGALTTASRSTTPTARDTRTRAVLIALQVAIAIVLLTGSAALGRAFLGLVRADGGYDVRAVVSMNVSLAGTRYENGAETRSYYDAVLERIRQAPGVVAVSATQSLPLNTDSFGGARFNVDNDGPLTLAPVVNVAPAFFSTMGARVMAGREFAVEDYKGGERLAIVNDAFAAAFGPPASLLGRTLTAGRLPTYRIVGVVRRLRYGQELDPGPQVFALAKEPRALTIVARLEDDSPAAARFVTDAARSVDPQVPIFDVKTMAERLDLVLARPKFYATAVLFFGGLALLLTVAGVYGMVSYSTVLRTREMGVRLALGATPSGLRRAELGRTGLMILVSAIAGAGLALAGGRYLGSLIPGAEQGLAATSTLAGSIMIGVAAAAIWSATRHVSRLDLSDVLRAESPD